MKAIISHDIDHITVWEHLSKDIILPKFIARSNIEVFSGKISINEFTNRLNSFVTNKWQNIDELIAFNQSQKIPSSFFIGVQNGVGLSYSKESAAYWIKRMLANNCEVNVHGIEFENFDLINKEFKLFSDIAQINNFGVRMHYVRKNENTFTNMDKAGYIFDSTEHAFKNPYKIGSMWEFPFQIMDGWVIEKGKRWQTQTLDEAKENTKILIEEAYKNNLNYLGIDFHDRYFSKSFNTWIDWYVWLIEYLQKNDVKFVNFKEAIQELENNTPTPIV